MKPNKAERRSHFALQPVGFHLFSWICAAILLATPSQTSAQKDRAIFDSDFKYPTYPDALSYIGRDVSTTGLVFKASKPPSFQIWWKEDDGTKGSAIVKKGESFGGDGRFTLVESTVMTAPDATGIPKEISELRIADAWSGREFMLVRDRIVNLPTYFAVFRSATDIGAPVVKVRSGTQMEFPGTDPRIARVLSPQEDRVRIRCEEKEYDMVMGKEGVENLTVYSNGSELRVEVPKDKVLEFNGSQPGVSNALPSNLTYRPANSPFFWGTIISGSEAEPEVKGTAKDVEPAKFPAKGNGS